jgi:hypothetical protein
LTLLIQGPVDISPVVNRDHVRLLKFGGHLGFAAETLTISVVVGEAFGEDFDGDDAILARVAGFVDLAHPALAQQLPQLVTPDVDPAREIDFVISSSRIPTQSPPSNPGWCASMLSPLPGNALLVPVVTTGFHCRVSVPFHRSPPVNVIIGRADVDHELTALSAKDVRGAITARRGTGGGGQVVQMPTCVISPQFVDVGVGGGIGVDQVQGAFRLNTVASQRSQSLEPSHTSRRRPELVADENSCPTVLSVVIPVK